MPRVAARSKAFLVMLALGVGAAASRAQEANCQVDAFRNATQPGGATTHMRVRNTGAACRIMNVGVPAERRNPATSGTITRPPTHGSAEFTPPFARYTPEKGYVGEDEFEYEASVLDLRNQPARMRVRVRVSVVEP
jgi:hypothetical protein